MSAGIIQKPCKNTTLIFFYEREKKSIISSYKKNRIVKNDQGHLFKNFLFEILLFYFDLKRKCEFKHNKTLTS